MKLHSNLFYLWIIMLMLSSISVLAWEKCPDSRQFGKAQMSPRASDPFQEVLAFDDVSKDILAKNFKHVNNPFENGAEVGNFIIDKNLKLGEGDEARVFIALHKETNGLYAAKWYKYLDKTELEGNGDYVSLLKLGRMRSCFVDSKEKETIMIMPLALGQTLSVARHLLGNTLQETITIKINLLNAYLAELTYQASVGVIRDDGSNPDIFDSKTANLLSVDFSSWYFNDLRNRKKKERTSYSENEIGVSAAYLDSILFMMHEMEADFMTLGGFSEKKSFSLLPGAGPIPQAIISLHDAKSHLSTLSAKLGKITKDL